MALTKEKLLVTLKEHKFLFSCLLCLFVSILAIKFGNISVVIYSLIVLASVFYLNITQTIALNGFGMFFYSLYDSEVLKTLFVLTIALTIKCIMLFAKKELTLKKDMLIPLSIIALVTLHFFLVGFEFSQIYRLLELVDCLILSFEFYLLRKHIDISFLIRFLSVLLIISCTIALLFNAIKFGPRTFWLDGIKIRRFLGYTPHPNWLSVWCGGLIALYMFLFFYKKVSIAETAIVSLSLTLFGYLSKSKTFFVLFGLLVVLYLIKSFIDDWRSGFVKLFVIIGCCLVLFVVFNDFFAEIISRFFSYRRNLDIVYRITTGRSKIWVNSLNEMFATVMGVLIGLGGCYTIKLHNSYLDVFVKYGLVGTALVGCFIGFFIFDLRKNRNKHFYVFFPLITVLLFMLMETLTKFLFLLLILSIFVLYDFSEKKQEVTRVLLYVPTLNYDTICHNILAITKNLSQSYSFDVLVNDMQREETRAIEKQLVQYGVHIYYQKSDSSIKKYISLVRFLSKSRGKYQVAHINSIGQYDGFAAYVARAYGQIPKVIYHSYSAGTNEKNVIQNYIQLYLIKSYSTDFATCSIEAATKMYGPDFVKKCSSIKVLDSFVDSSEYNYDRALREVARGRLNLANDYTILYVQDIYSSNCKKMINILLTTIHNYPNCRFVIAGDDQFNEMIKQKIKKYEIDENVCFISSSLNIKEAFNASDVLFVPSNIVCQSSVVTLAKNSDLPIVASSNIVGELGKDELVVPQMSPCEEWANAIISMPRRKRKSLLSGTKPQNDQKTLASEMIQYYNM